MCARPAARMLGGMDTALQLRPMNSLLTRTAERFPDRVAVRHRAGGAWHDVTFAELATIATEIALGLIALGIEPGDRVALMAETRPEWTYCHLAITLAGAVVVPIYPTSSPEEIEWVLADSGAAAVISERPIAGRAVIALDALPAWGASWRPMRPRPRIPTRSSTPRARPAAR